MFFSRHWLLAKITKILTIVLMCLVLLTGIIVGAIFTKIDVGFFFAYFGGAIVIDLILLLMIKLMDWLLKDYSEVDSAIKKLAKDINHVEVEQEAIETPQTEENIEKEEIVEEKKDEPIIDQPQEEAIEEEMVSIEPEKPVELEPKEEIPVIISPEEIEKMTDSGLIEVGTIVVNVDQIADDRGATILPGQTFEVINSSKVMCDIVVTSTRARCSFVHKDKLRRLKKE